MRKYSTVIFDMDGTLLDTLEDLKDSVNFSLAQFGYPLRTLNEIRSFVGNGVARLIELAIPDGRANPGFERCLDEFRRHYEQNMQNKTKAYDGILVLLQTLKKQGYKMAVVSNKFDAAVKELTPLYFGDALPVAVGESAGTAKKPAPDTVFKALDMLGSAPAEAIYVGDSEVDAETAKNSGLKFVGVTWGFRDRALLEQKGADWIIDKPAQLLGILGEEG